MTRPDNAAEQPLPTEVAVVIWDSVLELNAWLSRNAPKWAEQAGVPGDLIQMLSVFSTDRGVLWELQRIVEKWIGGADPIGVLLRRWLFDRVDHEDPNVWAEMRALHADCNRWAEATGGRKITETMFARKLRALGIDQFYHSRTRRSCVRGLVLRPGPVPAIRGAE